MTEPEKYLEAQVNYLTAGQAKWYERQGWIVEMDIKDGSWMATKLVDKPVQPGQGTWRGRKK